MNARKYSTNARNAADASDASDTGAKTHCRGAGTVGSGEVK